MPREDNPSTTYVISRTKKYEVMKDHKLYVWVSTYKRYLVFCWNSMFMRYRQYYYNVASEIVVITINLSSHKW